MCLFAAPVAAAAATSATAATATAAATTAAASTAAATAAATTAAATTAAATTAAAAGTSATLANLALGASLLSGAVGAYGAYKQGQQTKAMNEYQAKILGIQGDLAKRSAEANINAVQNQAAKDSKALAMRTARIMGAQDSISAANGTAGSVTANDIKLDTFDTGHLDQMAIQYNANMKSWGIREGLGGENWSLNAEASQYRMAGKNASSAGIINAGTSIIGSAAQVANNRLLLNSRGAAYV